MTVLINAEETVDKIQHPFCIKKKKKTTTKTKSSQQSRKSRKETSSLIRGIYWTLRTNITLNGKILDAFPLQSRQGYSLLSLLFYNSVEGLASAISQGQK